MVFPFFIKLYALSWTAKYNEYRFADSDILNKMGIQTLICFDQSWTKS